MVRYDDLVVTWKASERLTAVLHASFTDDEAGSGAARAYDAAGYLVYSINDWLSVGGRAEIFRDETGFFVGSFADNDDFIDIQRGKIDTLESAHFFRVAFSAS